MIGLLAAAAIATTPLRPAAPPAGQKPSPLWMMNFSETGEEQPCVESTLERALSSLRDSAKENPTTDYDFKWLNDNGEGVLRVTIKPRGKSREAVIFTLSKAFCLKNYALYKANPLWDYDERTTAHMTADRVIPPNLD